MELGIEAAVSEYYGNGPRSAASWQAFPPSIAARLREYRERAECAHCGRRIPVDVPLAVRGIQTFHESCAATWDRLRTLAPVVRSAPKVIGRIEGVAVLVNEPCECRTKDGIVREQFASGAFDRWLRAGVDVELRTDHQTRLQGRYRELEERQGGLWFAFELHDGVNERRALDVVKGGQCRGCSIAFRPSMHRWSWNAGDVLLRTDAKLTEVSLCIAGKPAWCGTWARMASI